MRLIFLLSFLVVSVGIGCTGDPKLPTFEEVYQTQRDSTDNVDSPAVWHGPNQEHLLLATAKETDRILVYDAATGAPLKAVGTTGRGLGQFDRPNGLAIANDLLFVVERDNARVQVLRLPGMAPLGTLGEAYLERPYGIATVPNDSTNHLVYVTDNYETPEGYTPADSLLGRRVHAFDVRVSGDSLHWSHREAFGETRGEGVLRVVESIGADPASGHLLIAEEMEGITGVLLYSLDGRFLGRSSPPGVFKHQAEGIALYACGSEGYWIVADQDMTQNRFLVLDRRTIEPLGAFRGNKTSNTDGVALTQVPFGSFQSGAFFAVHDDGNVSAFDWQQIALTLGLRFDCAAHQAAAK